MTSGPYQEKMVRELAGGLNANSHKLLIADNEAEDCLNIEFNRGSAASARGSIKFNNQAAPKSAPRFRSSGISGALTYAEGRSAPARSYGFIPYRKDQDLGGDYAEEAGVAADAGIYTNRRGRSFDLQVSFRVPSDQPVFSGVVLGENGDAANTITPGQSDESLGAFASIVQKGGDRTAPMSWALGLVNVGGAATAAALGSTGKQKTSWRLCFVWYDAPQWGEADVRAMQYRLTDSTDVVTDNAGAAATDKGYCSSAFKAVWFDRAIEPGRDYHVALQVNLDSGTVSYSGGTFRTAWNDDGWVRLGLIEDQGAIEFLGFGDTSSGKTSLAGAYIWCGNATSNATLKYLVRYGVRYSGRDAVFVGHGHRFAPWAEGGFIPFGTDAAPLEHGGYRMLDYSKHEVASVYATPASMPRAGLDYTAGTTYHVWWELDTMQVISGGATTGLFSLDPQGWDAAGSPGTKKAWLGFGATSGTAHDPYGLAGYWAAFFKTNGAQPLDGLRVRLLDFSDQANPFGGGAGQASRFATSVSAHVGLAADYGLSGSGDTDKVFAGIYPFRWRQFDLVVEDLRIYGSTRALDTSARAEHSVKTGFWDEDTLDPGKSGLLGLWPMNEAGGGVLRDIILGNNGYLCPFSMAQDENGRRGKKRLFLSGEGEALTLKLDEHPIIQRELRHMLSGASQGFAVEFTVTIPEACYAIPEHVNGGTEYLGRYVPLLAAWGHHDPAGANLQSTVHPLIALGHFARATGLGAINSFQKPVGFTLWSRTNGDQTGGDSTNYQLSTTTEHFNAAVYTGTAGYGWNTTADWVGKSVTIQFGVQSDGAGGYEVYLAATPKELFVSATAEETGKEFAYWRAQSIQKKDLVRSVICIGGGLDPEFAGLDLGVSEMNARLILDEVRVFATSGPGLLPANGDDGSSPDTGLGKLIGSRCMPARALEVADIELPLGDLVGTANVTEGSPSVLPFGSRSFYENDPWDTTKAVDGCYLTVAGDTYLDIPEGQTPIVLREFYYVDDVAAGGASLSLSTPYNAPTQVNARAGVFRLIGYTDFFDLREDELLTLGGGTELEPGTYTLGDVLYTRDFLSNPTPVGTPWKMRVYNPLGLGGIFRIRARWERGTKPHKWNPVLGLYGQGDRNYAAVQGALYEADDRWSFEGPTPDLLRSLAFRTDTDYVRVTDGAGFSLYNQSLAYWGPFWWYQPETTEGIQTIAWRGDLAENQNQDKTGTGNGGFEWWARINNGIPEFVVCSTATYSGGAGPPERGWYIARADIQLRAGEFAHGGWVLQHSAGNLLLPVYRHNGKPVSVSVNATQTGLAAGAWVSRSSIQMAVSATTAVLIGSSLVSEDAGSDGEDFAIGEIAGDEVVPSFRHGFRHGARGLMAQVRVTTNASGMTAAFDPFLDTPAPFTDHLLDLGFQDGFGHKANSVGTSSWYTIHSHPFLSLWHEMGPTAESVSMAGWNDRLFVANGGRVVRKRGDVVGFAGLLAPTTQPKYEIEKKPLWEPNQPGDTGTPANNDNADPENGPVVGAIAGATEQTNHYSTYGNNYLRQSYNSLMAWESGDYLAIKGYIRVRNTSGRIQVWGMRGSVDSGKALEIVDGKLRLVWYDTYLKETVGWETSHQVIEPGYVYYINIRKKWGGAWTNSVVHQTAANTNDLFVVRKFEKQAFSPDIRAWSTFHAKSDAAAGASVKNCISFTTDAHTPAAGTYTATGCVSTGAAVTYNGAAAGVIVASANAFHRDMLGMYFQWTGTADTALYRIATYTSATQVSVISEATGAVPDLSGAAYNNVNGGVFTGIVLNPVGSVTSSTQPDEGVYDVEWMGTALQALPLNGITAFSGETWSFGWVSTSSTSIFEASAADDIETGTDDFADYIYQTTPPGALTFNGSTGQTFTVIQSSQPNEDLEVAQDAQANISAESLFWNYIQQQLLTTGFRRVAVTFYDPDTNLESLPSPLLVIVPGGEDKNNPSGQSRILLTQVPVSPDGERIRRRLYMSTANNITPQRVLEIPDNESTAVAVNKTELEVGAGIPLSYTNGAPPRCKHLAADRAVMVYATTREQPDGYYWSSPYQPEYVPASNLSVFSTGDGTPITGVAPLSGRLIVFKRRGIRSDLLQQGGAIEQLVTRGVGCVAHATIVDLDDRLHFVDPAGVYVYTGNGTPIYLGKKIEKLWDSEVDRTELGGCSAAINATRGQYVVTYRRQGGRFFRNRFSVELADARTVAPLRRELGQLYRASKYRGPAISSMTDTVSRETGESLLIAGTIHGYVLWMDHPDTQYHMRGPSTAQFGSITGPISASSVSQATLSSGTFDQALDGLRGQTFFWSTNDKDPSEAEVLFEKSNVFYFMESVDVAPTLTKTAALAMQVHRFRTRMWDMDRPFKKVWRYLDAMYRPTSGTLYVYIYAGLEDDPAALLTRQAVDLSQEYATKNLATLRSERIQVEFIIIPPQHGVEFDLISMCLRWEDSERT